MKQKYLPDISEKRLGELVIEANELFKVLFPICRSLTGDGVRQTFEILEKVAHFKVKEIPSGTECYDWTVPDEWNISDAWIKDSSGKKIIDFKNSNIHVVNYSIPIRKKLSYHQLLKHLHYLEELPNAIPYRTTYYKKDWGFCLTHQQFKKLKKSETYEVCIESSLKPGVLNYAEAVIKGKTDQEYLISSYCCHPSLANDNLSGVIMWALLLREMQRVKTRHSYRFILIPETIGAIAYLHKNEEVMKKINGGFVLSTVAGPGGFGYKKSFQENSIIDQVSLLTLSELTVPHTVYPFDAYGSDELRYSSPFFRIPCGTICKDKYYEYKYYHTSLDDLNFVDGKYLIETFQLYLHSVFKLEKNITYKTLFPYVEPMLGKRGLYPSLGGSIKQSVGAKKKHLDRAYSIASKFSISGTQLDAIRWLLFDCDGSSSLLDISKKRNMTFVLLVEAAELLEKHGLLKREDAV